MSPRATVLFALAVAAAGCKKEPPAPTPGPVQLAIFQDDRQIATSALLGVTPRPLVEVAPGAPAPEAWLAIIVFDATGTATTAMAPSTNHLGAAAALVATKDGVTFGFAKGNLLDEPVTHVVKVVIKTIDDRGAIAAELAEHGGGDSGGGGHEGEGHDRPLPNADLKIAIQTVDGERELSGDQLVGLPPLLAPVGDKSTPGWNLLDVLRVAGLEGATVLTLTDSEGANLRIEGADLDPAATVLYLKLNRSGQIRFRRYGKKGQVWEMTGELRGITKISVVK